MSAVRSSALGLILVAGCELYLGDDHHPRLDAARLPDAAARPDAPVDMAENGPEDSPVLSPPPGAPCTAPLPTSGYVAPSTCGLSGPAVPTIVNTNHMRAALVAQWLKCSGAPFGTFDEVGLEFTQDDHWYKLYLDGAGGLVRGQGFDHEGTYELLYVVDHVQMNINIAGGGIIYTAPAFTTNPVKFRLSHMGGSGDYIRNDDTGACLPP